MTSSKFISPLNNCFQIDKQLEAIKQKNLYRVCPTVEDRTASSITIEGKKYLNFASNDYLGMAMNPQLLVALKEGVDLYGAGTGSSPLVTGKTKAHEALSKKLQDFTEKEDVLLFSTGFAANQALIKAFINLKADLILDKLVHASMQDAAFNAPSFHRYNHNDVNKAESLIKKVDKPCLFTEGVFSMDGDTSKLNELYNLKQQYKTPLVLDDAHGFGVIGKYGKGTLSHLNLPSQAADVYMGTLSKACGLTGAFIASDKYFIEYLINTCREYIYSTAAPACLAHATCTALDLIQKSDNLRQHLQNLILRFKNNIKQWKPDFTTTSVTSIQPVIIGETDDLLKVSNMLKSKGIWCGAIRPPTVPQHTSRLRITITAAHTEADVDYLTSNLQEAFTCVSRKL